MPPKTTTQRLHDCLQLSGYRKMLAATLLGLGYSREDTQDMSGLNEAEIKAIRLSACRIITAVRNDPDASRAFLLRKQQDMTLARGFALSHSTSTLPRELRNIASTSAIIAKATGLDKPASPQAGNTAPKPPPSRPA